MALDPVTAVFEVGSKLIDHFFPDAAQQDEAKQKLTALQQSGELAAMAMDSNIAIAQIGVNNTEAANVNTFVSGWRPFVGWVGGFALAYAAILEPLLRFIARVCFGYDGDFPVIDTMLTMQVLMGILGLGGMRSYEKFKGVA